MQPDDIANLVWTDTPAISPDERHVAYVVRWIDGDAEEYHSRVWVTPTDGSTRPRPLTSGRNKEANPCWAPDGATLAFTAQVPGPDDDPEQSIQLLPFDGPGEAAVLVSGPEGFESLTFSPDGRWLAYVTRTRSADYEITEAKKRPPRKIEGMLATLNGEGFITDRPEHTYVLPTNGSSGPINLTPGSAANVQPAWFPDSKRLAVGVDPFGVDLSTHVEIVSVSGEDDPVVVTTTPGAYAHPSPAPDGSRIALLGYDDPRVYPDNDHVGLVGIEQPQRPRWLTTALDRTWSPFPGGQRPVWIDDQALVAGVEDRGNVHLYAVGPDRDPRLLVGGERMITSWDAVGGAIAFTASTSSEPAELFVLVDGEERCLTDHSDALQARVRPRPAERFTAVSGAGDDAVEVDAWILTPHDFDPAGTYPMLLNIHGGPFTQYGNTFFDEAQLQCGAGFVVVLSNPRGGSGRHNAWGQSIIGPKHPIVPGSGWGSVDFDDILAVTDAALDQFPFIDPDRVGVLGGSYGGYLTTWAATHSDRFAAACSERAANNLLSLEYGSDAAGFFRTEVGTTFLDDPAEYLRMSPITYVENLDTPLLILHSDDDLRCPVDQATQLYVACLLLDKPDVEFYRFPGESHELTRSGSPTHRKQRIELILEFFHRHLQPSPQGPREG